MGASELLKVGIVGFGLVGQQRARSILANPVVSLVAISEVRDEYVKLAPRGTKVFKDYKEMILAEKLNVLIVTLPQYLSVEAVCFGLANGCHVFCETPAARTPAEFAKIIDASKKSNHIVHFGSTHRFQKSIRDAKAVIESGNLGTIIGIDGVYGKSELIHYTKGWRTEKEKAGGGILMDQGIHLLDVLHMLVGDLDVVSSLVDSSYFKHDVEDNVHALLRSRSGVHVSLRTSALLWSHEFRLDVNLTDGYLRVSGILEMNKVFEHERLVVARRYHNKGKLPTEEVTVYTDGGDNEAWQQEMDLFIKNIADKVPKSGIPVSDAFANLELVHKIYAANKNGHSQRSSL